MDVKWQTYPPASLKIYCMDWMSPSDENVLYSVGFVEMEMLELWTSSSTSSPQKHDHVECGKTMCAGEPPPPQTRVGSHATGRPCFVVWLWAMCWWWCPYVWRNVLFLDVLSALSLCSIVAALSYCIMVPTTVHINKFFYSPERKYVLKFYTEFEAIFYSVQ